MQPHAGPRTCHMPACSWIWRRHIASATPPRNPACHMQAPPRRVSVYLSSHLTIYKAATPRGYSYALTRTERERAYTREQWQALTVGLGAGQERGRTCIPPSAEVPRDGISFQGGRRRTGRPCSRPECRK
eukprot:COSAG01_NODE_6751_length_3515_cov_3.095141_4_plen_130_part_00